MWEGAGEDIFPGHSPCQGQFPESFDWPVQHRNNAAAKIWSFPFKQPEEIPLCLFFLTSDDLIYLACSCRPHLMICESFLLCSLFRSHHSVQNCHTLQCWHSVPVTMKIRLFSIQGIVVVTASPSRKDAMFNVTRHWSRVLLVFYLSQNAAPPLSRTHITSNLSM